MQRRGGLQFKKGNFGLKIQYKNLILKVAIIESPFEGG
jgi:hypothetical protein